MFVLVDFSARCLYAVVVAIIVALAFFPRSTKKSVYDRLPMVSFMDSAPITSNTFADFFIIAARATGSETATPTSGPGIFAF